MTCRELADFLGDYAADELPADVRAQFDHHLGRCVNCRRYLAHYNTAVQLGQQAFDDDDAPVPADVPEELVAAILAAGRRIG